jgi:hypothetical protein
VRKLEDDMASFVDVAKLGLGLVRPSVMLLLLLYGLFAGCPRIDCSPRMLPRLSVISRSGGPRWLRLRSIVPPGPGLSDPIDERLLFNGCRICWLFTALYISCDSVNIWIVRAHKTLP